MDWLTPPEILKAAYQLTGSLFDLDVASSDAANETILADYYFTENGLDRDWAGKNVLIFPPSGSTKQEVNIKPQYEELKWRQELAGYSVPLARIWFDTAWHKWLNFNSELQQGIFIYAGRSKPLFDILTDSKRKLIDSLLPVCLIRSADLTWVDESKQKTRTTPPCCAVFWFYPENLLLDELREKFYDSFSALGRCMY